MTQAQLGFGSSYGNVAGQNSLAGMSYRGFSSPLSANSFPSAPGVAPQIRPQGLATAQTRSFGSVDYGQTAPPSGLTNGLSNGLSSGGLNGFPFAVSATRSSVAPIGLGSLSSSPVIGNSTIVNGHSPNSSVMGVSQVTIDSGVVGSSATSTPVSTDKHLSSNGFDVLAPTSPKSKLIQRPHPIQRPSSTTSKSDDLHGSSASSDDVPPVMGSRALYFDDLDEEDAPFFAPSARRPTQLAANDIGSTAGVSNRSSSWFGNGGGHSAFFPESTGLNGAPPIAGIPGVRTDLVASAGASSLFDVPNTWNSAVSIPGGTTAASGSIPAWLGTCK